MPFYGNSFSYDGIPSEMYGLTLSEIDGSAVTKTMGSSPVTILNKKIYRRSAPYFYGATPSEVLKFSISAHANGELTAPDFELVQKWLFSSRTYKKLQIFQVDMADCYFNAILNSPQITRIGNLIAGFTAEVECDSPYAYMFPATTTYTYTSSSVDDRVTFYNSSDEIGDYLYPSLVITMNNIGGNVSIENESDSNRTSTITGLSASEVITANSSLQTFTSSTGLKRLSLFNKHWLRLIPGENILHITGSVANIAMTTQFVAKKIGG